MSNALPPVLVGFDASADAVRAADWGAAVAAARPGTALHLVQALSLPPIPMHATARSAADVLRVHEQEAQAALEAERDRRSAGGLAVEIHLRRWPPAETVLEHADASGAGLIVVGQRGSATSRVLLGSVSGKVARSARVPVVVIRGAGGAVPARRVLLAADGSPSCLAAAAAVATWLPESRVTAVRVLEPGETAEAGPLVGALEASGLGSERCRLEFAHGPTARTLLDLARDGDYDLVAAGRRGLSEWEGLLTGAVSEKLLLLAPCPILVAH